MNLIKWILSLPVFIAVVVFVLQNRMQVTISFWPFAFEASMPVSILAMGLLLLGFVMGGVATSIALARARFDARRLRARLSDLEQTIGRDKEERPCSCSPTILYKGRYQAVPISGKESSLSSRSILARFWKGKKP